jgi:uncharacterized membrane protein
MMKTRVILTAVAAFAVAVGLVAVAGTRIDAQITGAPDASIPEPRSDAGGPPPAARQGARGEAPEQTDRPALLPSEELEPPPPPQVTQGLVRGNTHSANFCNRSGVGKIWMAQSYWDVARNDWSVEGWWGLDNGACMTFSRVSSAVYYHAYGGGWKWWNAFDADINFCTPTVKFKHATGANCQPKELSGFKKLTLGSGVAQASFGRPK